MWTSRLLYFGSALVMGITGCLIIPRTGLHAQQGAPVSIGGNDIGGVVSSSKGPEAGVWVIAETGIGSTSGPMSSMEVDRLLVGRTTIRSRCPCLFAREPSCQCC